MSNVIKRTRIAPTSSLVFRLEPGRVVYDLEFDNAIGPEGGLMPPRRLTEEQATALLVACQIELLRHSAAPTA